MEEKFAPKTFENGIKKEFGSFVSADKKTEIHYVTYTPATPPSAVVQIVHGMNDEVARYEDFALFLAKNGVFVCGSDHLGHGMNITDEKSMWYFGKGASDRYLAADIAALVSIMRKKYRRLPYIMFGHSLGSFVVRDFMSEQKYTDMVDGAILCGTSAERAGRINRLAASLICKIKGEKSRPKSINKLFYGRLNRDYEHLSPYEGKNAWVCGNREITEKIDSYDGGMFFTAKGFLDLFNLLERVNGENWASTVPQSLPILLIAGANDAVGSNGEGVKQVCEKLSDAEICNLQMKLYPNMRHEILNEKGNALVYDDILHWITSITEGKLAWGTENGERRER